MSRASRVLSLARNRRPVRRFADRPVPAEAIECILECACYAPSAREAQPWRFVVVREALARHRLAAAAFNHPHLRSAPLAIVGAARIHSHVSGTGRPSHPVDLAAATQALCLAAADLGLSTSWIPGFREPAVREVLGIPPDVPVLSIVAVGYPDGLDALPGRRPLAETVAWDRWGSDPAAGAG